MDGRRSEANLPKDAYFSKSYQTDTQLWSMCQQIIEISKAEPTRLLEVGKGSGFVSSFFLRSGTEVVTADVNESLEPDVVCSVLSLLDHFQADSFSCVLCAEVLEHLPLKDFSKAIDQLSSVTKHTCILTLPRRDKVLLDCAVRLKLPKFGVCEFSIRIPHWKRGRMFSGHFWEVNSSKDSNLERLKATIRQKFTITRDYRFRWNTYHQVFILKKKGQAESKAAGECKGPAEIAA
jgi:hypothetical protein